MNISGVGSGSGVAGDGEAVKRSGSAAESGFADALAGAAEEGREAAGAESSGDYPVEAYSIPGWYVGLTGGYTTITARIGDSYMESRTGYEKLSPGDQDLYDEYSAILDEAFHDGLDLIGVSGDTGKYYNDFVKNNDNQRLVREAIYDSLESNPRAVELMRHFGITTG